MVGKKVADRVPEKIKGIPMNVHPDTQKIQREIRAKFAEENKTAPKGQIVFVGSSLMEHFPIEEMQKDLGLSKIIYNRGIRATTTADLLEHINVCILDLKPDTIFINIGSNDIGFDIPEAVFLANYDRILRQIKEKLPETQVYVMAYYPVNMMEDVGEPQGEQGAMFDARNNEGLNAASGKAAQLARKYDFEFINVNDGLAGADGNLRKELTSDGRHILPAGYEIVLENIKKYL